MASQYKHLKEAFVSNLNGGTISEINLVTLVAPVSRITNRACKALIRVDFGTAMECSGGNSGCLYPLYSCSLSD